MKEKLSIKESILVGLLLFGLYFGAGNLIFPVSLGQMAANKVYIAVAGFLLTGVTLPILGVVGSALVESESLLEMASLVSKKYAIFFTSALYLTIGPLFAIPRTATTAFEVGIKAFIGDNNLKLSLLIFSIIFFTITLIFSLKPTRILDWIGKYLTPIFLILLSVLILITYLKPMGNVNDFLALDNYSSKPFISGIIDGYHTMDALASLAFAIIIISNVKKFNVVKPKNIAIETLKSGFIAAFLMSIIYISLAYMGSTSINAIGYAENGGIILSLVSNHYFQTFGQLLLCGIVFFATLKTAIGLITACSEMFSQMFSFLTYRQYAILFTLTSFIIANFGLNNIIMFSIPVLMFLYPLAITLIVLSLLEPLINKNKQIYIFTTYFTLFAAIFDLLNNLPNSFKQIKVIESLLTFADKYFKGFDLGFGWITFSIVGFIVGYVISKVKGVKNYESSTT